jgi:hypothetical protein
MKAVKIFLGIIFSNLEKYFSSKVAAKIPAITTSINSKIFSIIKNPQRGIFP